MCCVQYTLLFLLFYSIKLERTEVEPRQNTLEWAIELKKELERSDRILCTTIAYWLLFCHVKIKAIS